MAESTLSVTRDDLRRALGRFLGKSRDITAWGDADFETDVEDIIDKGCRQFYAPPVLPGERTAHRWSFMRPTLEMTLNASYSTGRIQMTAGGVVTQQTPGGSDTWTIGTWPSWAAAGQVIINGTTYTIASRTSDTVIQLDDTSVTAIASNTTYSIQQVDYDLPDLFGGLVGPLHFTGDSSNFEMPLREVSYGMILDKRQAGSLIETQPVRYAVHVQAQTGAAGTRWTLSVDPAPDADYGLVGEYFIDPYQLTANLPYPMGGQPHSETLRESVLAAAELEMQGDRGPHYAEFVTRLVASVSFDRSVSTPRNFGYAGDPSVRGVPRMERHRGGSVTFNGQSWITP